MEWTRLGLSGCSLGRQVLAFCLLWGTWSFMLDEILRMHREDVEATDFRKLGRGPCLSLPVLSSLPLPPPGSWAALSSPPWLPAVLFWNCLHIQLLCSRLLSGTPGHAHIICGLSSLWVLTTPPSPGPRQLEHAGKTPEQRLLGRETWAE